MVSKIFLSVVGFIYLGLAVWCSLSPAITSNKIGFELIGGSGQSEFLVVYGGLELGLSLIFLLPLVRSEFLLNSLISCLIIHSCLVVFRTVSFFCFSDISAMTYQLAVGEWLILILSVLCLILQKRNK
jgi:hypothetical protein